MVNWEKHLKDEEKQRLSVIRGRRSRIMARNREYTVEIHKLMNRAIRRMRRQEGKK